MKTNPLNDTVGFTMSASAAWKILHRQLTELNDDTTLDCTDRIQMAFNRLLVFYTRIGNLLWSHDITISKEDFHE
jgi:hypothetical protein